jgi:hypothetical protein
MNQNQGNAGSMPQQININPEDTTGIKCGNCGGEFYIPVYMLRKVSALISPSGREEVIQVPVMSCAGCGTPYAGVDAPEADADAKPDGSTIITK